MRAYHSLIHSLYLLLLPVLAVAVPVYRKSEIDDIYWVIGMLLPVATALFFAFFWRGKLKDVGALRLIFTAGLGAGTLIALGQFYIDAEPSALPLIAAALVFLGWMHWNVGFSILAKTTTPESIPASWTRGKKTVCLVGIHPQDPSFRAQLKEFATSSIKDLTVVVSPLPTSEGDLPVQVAPSELNSATVKTPMPFPYKDKVGYVPMLLVADAQGKVLFGKASRDRRVLASAAFAARLLED